MPLLNILSALKENENQLDSIQGKITLFTNSVQTMWMNLIDSNMVKSIVDAGTFLIKQLDTLHGKIIAIIGALVIYKKFKDKTKFSDMFNGAAEVLTKVVSETRAVTGATLAEAIARKTNNEELLQELLTKAGLIGVSGKLTKEQIKVAAATLSEAFANGKLTASQYLATMSSMGLKTALQGLWTVLKANPIIAIAAVVAVAALAFDHFHTTAQEAAGAAKEAFDEIQSVVESTKSVIQELESELTTLQDKIDELNGKQLSFAEDQELEKLKKQREELEHSLKVQQQLLELQQDASNKQAVASMKAYTKAASEGAEKTQETAKNVGTIGGVLAGVGVALGVLLAVPTGGTSLAASLGLSGTAVAGTAAASGAALGVVGNKAGEAIGSGIASNDGTYDSWYETYTKALETSRKEEQKALEKYQKDSDNVKKLDKWQETQRKTSEIETEMYEHLSQMHQYYSGLEYGISDEIDKELDTWYNFLDKLSIAEGASGAEVTALDRIFGENASEEIQTLKEQIIDAVNSGKDFDFDSAITGSKELNSILNYVGLNAEDVKNYFAQIGDAAGNISTEKVTPVKMYSDLLEDAESYNEILLQTSEITINNTKVTQEYKDALVELVGSEEEVNKYFDENNKLIVKDAKGLNNLVNATKKNTAASAALAKTQARLQYYELYKKLKQLVGGQAVTNAATLKQIVALYQEMNALEKTIARYSVLEEQLLGAANAYEKFEQAQEIDAQTDYITSAEEMVQALGEAFNTAELGTEAAQTAIAGLVPESVFEDLDTVDEKMAAIYDYFKNGKIAQYFDISFDEDGNIESAEMKLGNLRKFIEDGLSGGVFEGSDWQHFDLSESITSLEDFAEQMGVTKEVAFAFLESLEDHDIEWLNGDYTSLLEKLLPESLENDIYENVSALADLEMQLANGEITAEEYATTLAKLASEEATLADRAREETTAWYDKTEQLEKYKSKLQEYQKQLETGVDSDGNIIDATKVQQNVSEIEGYIDTLSAELRELEEPTELTMQIALEDIQEELDTIENEFESQGIDIKAHLVWDTENSEWQVSDSSEIKDNENVQQYADLLNDQSNLETLMDDGIVTVEEHLSNISEILQSIHDFQTGKTTSETKTDTTDVQHGDGGKFGDSKSQDQKSPDTTSISAWDEFWGNIDSFFDGIGEQAGVLKEKLSKFFAETVPEKWDEFWNSVGEFFAPLIEQASVLKEKVTSFFTNTIPEKWDEFWTKAAEVWNDVQTWADTTKDKVVNFFTVTIPEKWGQFWDKVGEVWDDVQEWAETTKDNVVNFFTVTLPEKWDEFWEKVDTFLTEEMPYAIGYAAGAVVKFFTETVPEKWDEFWDDVGEAWEDTKTWAGNLKDKAVEFFTKTIPDAWSNFWEDVGDFIDESIMPALSSFGNSIKSFFTETIPEKWSEFWTKAGEAWADVKDWATATKDDVVAFFTETIPEKWREFWAGVGSFIDENITPALESFANAVKTFFTETIPTKWNEFWINVGDFIGETIIPALTTVKDKITEFFTVTIPEKWNTFWNDIVPSITENITTGLTTIKEGITTFFTVTLPGEINGLWNGISSWIVEKATTFWGNLKAGFSAGRKDGGNESGTAGVNGTAHAKGTVRKGKAYKSGDWGLPKSEHNALVGELGTELVVNPQTGRYYTVGDNGAEFVDLPKNSIIFNHKQTEGLLKNGHIASRGKAYAEGNAHAVTIWPQGSSKTQWEGTGYSSWDDPTYDLSEALNDVSDSASNASDAADEFAESLDWIEVRLEEWDETLGKLNAQLENATNYAEKNNKINQLISASQGKRSDLLAGAAYYEKYAQKYLNQLSGTYRTYAQNGAIAITDFAGDASEATVEAIQNYRDYIQKAADLNQQAEEVLTEIRDLAIQKIDNAEHSGSVKATIEDSQTEKLQNAVDFDEERGLITDPNYYAAMMENSERTIAYLTTARNEMQKAFDKAVRDGQLIAGSDEWYENLDKLYQMDAEIDEATIELEEFQNAINDIYWENFDELINRFDYISDETQGLIDLMSELDMVSKPDNDKGWSADDVEWTKEGLASLGLHAQEMERAEAKAKMYAKAIDDLTAEYKAGHYSESEYYEKLNELTQGQYDAIEAAQEEKEAIKELNEQRVDAVKEGIELQIKAYEELIEKKKEELDAEKDLYDFQQSTMEQQKSITEIRRKIAALSGDSSASATAKRKQLEAELAEARADLDESYYDRSVENQQNALDKELENFQKEKEAEIEQWEKWLENVEQVVTESLGIVQANAAEIGATLTEKTEEYGLTVSSAVLSPWQDGAIAIDEYTTRFGDAVSSTTEQLETIRAKWQEVREELEAANIEADKYYKAGTADGSSVAEINKENANYVAAKKVETSTSNKGNNSTSKPATPTQKPITVGGKINAGSAKIYSYVGDTNGARQYYSSDPIYTVLEEKSGYLRVRHHKSSKGTTGWFKKSDVKAYAKGSMGVAEDQWALLHELGDELTLSAGPNGKLQYITKGTAVIPHDISENLMQLGQLDPSEVLNRNKPQIAPSKSIVNNNMEISVDASVGTLIHVDRLDGNNPDEVIKLVDKAWDKKMQGLNNAIKKFSR
jgi:hypothetical protein